MSGLPSILEAMLGQQQPKPQVGPPIPPELQRPGLWEQAHYNGLVQPQQQSPATALLTRNPGADLIHATSERSRKKQVDEQYKSQGSFFDALHRAKKLSGMGDGFDSLFQSSLWIRGQVPVDDSETGSGGDMKYVKASPIMKEVDANKVKVAPEAMREVARLMRTPEGRAQLQKQVDEFREAREQHYAATPKQEVTTTPELTAQGDALELAKARESNLNLTDTGRANLQLEKTAENLTQGLMDIGGGGVFASMSPEANQIARLGVQLPVDIAMSYPKAINDTLSMFDPQVWETQAPGDRLGAALNVAQAALTLGTANAAVKAGKGFTAMLGELLGIPHMESTSGPALAQAAQAFMHGGDAAVRLPQAVARLAQGLVAKGVPEAKAAQVAEQSIKEIASATPDELEQAVTHAQTLTQDVPNAPDSGQPLGAGLPGDQMGQPGRPAGDVPQAPGETVEGGASVGAQGDVAGAVRPQHPVSIYSGKDVPIDYASEGSDAFKVAAQRVKDNAGVGYVIDTDGKVYKISPNSKRAKLSSLDELSADYPDLAAKYGAKANETTQEANAVREVQAGQRQGDEGELAQGQKGGQEAGQASAEQRVPPERFQSQEEGSQVGAVANQEAAAVHGPLREQPVEGGQALPPEEGGAGVRAETGQEEVTKYAASNAASNDLRSAAGLDELQPSPHAAVDPAQASATYDPAATMSRARQVVEQSRQGVRPPVPTAEEVFHMDMAAAEAGGRLNQAKDALAKAIEEGADTVEAQRMLDMARDDVDTLTLASKMQGKEQSIAFSARNKAFTEDLTPAGVYRDFTIAKGAKLTEQEAKQAEELGRRLQAAESEIKLAEARAETAKAQARIAELEKQVKARGGRVSPRAGTRNPEQIAQARAAAVERIKSKLMDASSTPVMSDPFGVASAAKGAKVLADIAPDVMEVVKLYAEEGVVRLAEVVARVRHTVGEDVLSEQDVHKIIAGDYEREAKQVTRSEAVKQVAAWKKELRTAGVGQETALKESIARYEAKIKAGEFPARPKPTLPDDLQPLYVKREALKAEAASMKAKIQAAQEARDRPLLAKVGHELFNVPRTLVASTDLSAGLNQGMFTAYTHPDVWAKANVAGLYALKNEANYYKVIGEVRANKYFDDAVAGGLKIGADAPHFDPGGDMMLSRMLSHSAEVGGIGLNPIAASERAYVATLTKLRMDMFAHMVDAAEKPAMFGLIKPKKLTLSDYKEIADWVNVSTGAGTNGIAKGLQSANKVVPVIFSPSYMVSRWQLAWGSPGRLLRAVKTNPRVAYEIVKDYAKFAGAAGGMLYAAKMAGADVELDPRSTAFGKIHLGGTTIDPFSGILAPYRVMAQSTAGAKQANGGVMPPNAATTLGYYATGKFSPLMRSGINFFSGLAKKEMFGKSYDPRTPEGLKNTGLSMLPIQVQSQMDLAEDKKLTEAQKDALRILVLLGLSTQEDKPVKKSSHRSSSRSTSR